MKSTGAAVRVPNAGQAAPDDADLTVEQQLVATSMELLPIVGADVVTVDLDGEPHVSASSSQQIELLETIQLESNTGPCVQAYRTGQPVTVENLSAETDRWPALARTANEFRYGSACALPLDVHHDRVGVLNLFCAGPGPMSPGDITVAKALAAVAAAGIVQERTLSQSTKLNQQLQTALDSRVVIEQAKGVLAARCSIDMPTAFTMLRSHARKTRQRLPDLAAAVVQGTDTSIFEQQLATNS